MTGLSAFPKREARLPTGRKIASNVTHISKKFPPSKMMRTGDVRIGERHVGDNGLGIGTIGLLFEAVKKLGWIEIPVVEIDIDIDIDAVVHGEFAESAQRRRAVR